MRDSNLIFHDGTNFTATVTPVSTTRSGGSAVLDVGKSGIAGLWAQISLIAAIVGAGAPTVTVKFQFSDSATFASGVEDGPSYLIDENTAAGTRREWLLQSKRRYWRALLTKGGTTLTSIDVEVAIVSGPNPDSVS